MNFKEVEEKSAHYVRKIESGQSRDLLHDKDAYSLYKLILKRFTRGMKDAYEKNSHSAPIRDFYYEGYDYKGRLQQASTWLPLDLLGYGDFYEAFRKHSPSVTTSEFIAERSIVKTYKDVCNRIDINLGGACDYSYKFFLTLNLIIGSQTIANDFLLSRIVESSKFLMFLKGDIDGIEFSPFDLHLLAPRFSEGVFKQLSLCIGNKVNYGISTPQVTGVDFEDPRSVLDFLIGLDPDFRTRPSGGYLRKNRPIQVQLRELNMAQIPPREITIILGTSTKKATLKLSLSSLSSTYISLENGAIKVEFKISLSRADKIEEFTIKSFR